jgi:hemerythrin-like domain-containing protein
MPSIRDFMAESHRECDSLFADVENAVSMGKWELAIGAWPVFLRDLIHHFEMEEKVLFPFFEKATGMASGPTVVMRLEHDQMRSVSESLSAALRLRDKNGFLGLAESMMVLLQQHNMKEEQILYPMTDRVAGDATTILEEMKNV